MFEYCPLHYSVDKICPFAVHRNGDIYCGHGTTEDNPESLVRKFKRCMLIETASKKERKRLEKRAKIAKREQNGEIIYN